MSVAKILSRSEASDFVAVVRSYSQFRIVASRTSFAEVGRA